MSFINGLPMSYVLESDPVQESSELPLWTQPPCSEAIKEQAGPPSDFPLSLTEHFYERNLGILSQEFDKKFGARCDLMGAIKAEAQAGEDVLIAASKLKKFLAHICLREQEYHEGYLKDIFHYWRKYALPKEIQKYEDVWVYVAGRPHRQE